MHLEHEMPISPGIHILQEQVWELWIMFIREREKLLAAVGNKEIFKSQACLILNLLRALARSNL